jgi:hypothetical protein
MWVLLKRKKQGKSAFDNAIPVAACQLEERAEKARVAV